MVHAEDPSTQADYLEFEVSLSYIDYQAKLGYVMRHRLKAKQTELKEKGPPLTGEKLIH